MAETAVQRRPAAPGPLADPTYSSSLDIDSFGDDDNDYATLKKLQRHLEYVLPGTPQHLRSLPADLHLGTSAYRRNTSKMSSGV